MKRFPSSLAVAALLSIGLFASPARANFTFGSYTSSFTGRSFNNATSALLDSYVMHDMQVQVFASARPGAGTASQASALRFKPSGSSKVPAAFAAALNLSASDRAGLAQWLQALLTDYDNELVKQHAEQMRDDLGGAFEFATQASYYVASSGSDIPDAAQPGLTRQLSTALLASARVRRMSDAQKQRVYDGVVLLGSLEVAMLTYARQHGDAALLAQDQQLADAFLKQLFGAPAKGLQFGADGASLVR